MGWLLLLLLILLSAALLWALGIRRGMLQACAAALLFGASGYALQGRPGLPGVPANRLEAVGKGDTDPVGDNRTAQGRAQNRRVEIDVAR